MSLHDEGGFAFPLTHPTNPAEANGGMSLRDYYAGQIVAGIAASYPAMFTRKDFEEEAATIIDHAFKMADMMIVRSRKASGDN